MQVLTIITAHNCSFQLIFLESFARRNSHMILYPLKFYKIIVDSSNIINRKLGTIMATHTCSLYFNFLNHLCLQTIRDFEQLKMFQNDCKFLKNYYIIESIKMYQILLWLRTSAHLVFLKSSARRDSYTATFFFLKTVNIKHQQKLGIFIAASNCSLQLLFLKSFARRF